MTRWPLLDGARWASAWLMTMTAMRGELATLANAAAGLSSFSTSFRWLSARFALVQQARGRPVRPHPVILEGQRTERLRERTSHRSNAWSRGFSVASCCRRRDRRGTNPSSPTLPRPVHPVSMRMNPRCGYPKYAQYA